MAEPKTKLNDASVADFLNGIKVEQVRQDCWAIVEMMQKATKAEPKMWGSNIVGFGSSPIKYANGREADCCISRPSFQAGLNCWPNSANIRAARFVFTSNGSRMCICRRSRNSSRLRFSTYPRPSRQRQGNKLLENEMNVCAAGRLSS